MFMWRHKQDTEGKIEEAQRKVEEKKGGKYSYMDDVLMYVAFFMRGHSTVTHWKPP